MHAERKTVYRLLLIIVLIMIISLCHYSTSVFLRPLHDIYRRLYYIPIILSAFWFGLRGGVISAVVITAIYIPHVLLQWSGEFFSGDLEKTLEIILFNIVGLVTGYLSELQLRTAKRLKSSYSELKEKTRQMFVQDQQIRHMDRLSALGELSAGIAHEVRNPLASIMMTADILSADDVPPEERKKFWQILQNEIKRLDHVIRGFLDFAKPKSPQKIPSNIGDIIESVTGLLHHQIRQNKIELESDLADLPSINIDPEQIKQVLLNIMLNAIQAMPDGGVLQVRTFEDDDFAVFEISDTGAGVPADLQNNIFDPFFTTKQYGTGLGLSIVSKIIDSHGGKISVASRTAPDSSNPGTKFTIKLRTTNHGEKSKHSVGR